MEFHTFSHFPKIDEWGLFKTSTLFDWLTDVLSCATGAAHLFAHRCDKHNTLGLSKHYNHVWGRSFFAHLLYNLICPISGH